MTSASKSETNAPMSTIPSSSRTTRQNPMFPNFPRPPFIPRQPSTMLQYGRGNFGFVNSIMKGVPMSQIIPQSHVRKEPPEVVNSQTHVNPPTSFPSAVYSQAAIGQKPSDKSKMDQESGQNQVQDNTVVPHFQQDVTNPQHYQPTQSIDHFASSVPNLPRPRRFPEPIRMLPSRDTRQYTNFSLPRSQTSRRFFPTRFNPNINGVLRHGFEDHRAPKMIRDYHTPPPYGAYYPFDNHMEEDNRYMFNSVPMPDSDPSRPVFPLPKESPVTYENGSKRVAHCPNSPYEVHVDIQLSDEQNPCHSCRPQSQEFNHMRQEANPHNHPNNNIGSGIARNLVSDNTISGNSNSPVEFKTHDGDVVRVLVRKPNENCPSFTVPQRTMTQGLQTRGRPNASKCVLCKVNDAMGRLSPASSSYPSQNVAQTAPLPNQSNENRGLSNRITATPLSQDLSSSNPRMRGATLDFTQQVGGHTSDLQQHPNQPSFFQTGATTKNTSVQVDPENLFSRMDSKPSMKSSSKDSSTQVDLHDLSYRMQPMIMHDAATESSTAHVNQRASSQMLSQILAQMLPHVDIGDLFLKMLSTSREPSNASTHPHVGSASAGLRSLKTDAMTQIGVGDLSSKPLPYPANGAGREPASQNALGDLINSPRGCTPTSAQSFSMDAFFAALAKLGEADFSAQVNSKDIAQTNRQIAIPSSIRATEDSFPLHLSVNDKSISLPREMMTNSNGTTNQSQMPAANAVVNLHIPDSLSVLSAHEDGSPEISTDNARSHLPKLKSKGGTSKAQDKGGKTTVLVRKTAGNANATVNLHVMTQDKEFDSTTDATSHREAAIEEDEHK